jgi:threonine aldolase
VVGSRDLVARAREVRHLYGGAMRQAGVLAAAALVALENIDRLADDHANARGLAETVAAAVPGSVDLAAVQTNMVLLSAEAFGTDGPGLVERLAGLGVLAADTDPGRVRLVFSYEVSASDAERAAKAVVAAAG